MAVTLDGRYGVDPQVAIRPEPFGALCYHYGNRRLSFLRSPELLEVVRRLDDAPSLAEALREAGVAEARWPSFVKALATLEDSEMVHGR